MERGTRGTNMAAILDILMSSDTPISTPQLMTKLLEDYGLDVKRRMVMDLIHDLNALFQPWTHGNLIGARTGLGYYIDHTLFEDGELQFLLDAVVWNDDLTKEDKLDLREKITRFATNPQLDRLVTPAPAHDAKNFNLILNITTLMKAIDHQRPVRFRYVDYAAEDGVFKEVESPRGNDRPNKYDYIVSPYRVIQSNNHYYMIGYFSKHKDQPTTFRVDRMRMVREATRKSYVDITDAYDMDEYIRNTFNMFMDGDDVTLVLAFHKSLTREMVSRFGMNISVRAAGPGHYEATVPNVRWNQGLILWLMSLGDKVEVRQPLAMRTQIRDALIQTLNLYQEKKTQS